MDAATDKGYSDSVETALRLGINFIDTSLNYRNQRSERAIGAALQKAIAANLVQRDEFVVCTKAGYLTPQAVPSQLAPADVVGGVHSMAPNFLADQLSRSHSNLGLDGIDVFYLHNPETQLAHIESNDFYERVKRAFAFLEEAVANGAIRCYGTATWDGYRRRPGAPGALSLPRLVQIARDLVGDEHHFRFIQLPFNLAMREALAVGLASKSVLAEAEEAGITVVASASLLQARLAGRLPDEIVQRIPGLSTDAQRAIQFTRSTPGITVALAGMSNPAHVRENAALATCAPLSAEQYRAVFGHA
jgi:aryl-alcohol dehydrogenase-like predicted oxidoreductase